jgi:hypothetical protein
MKIETVFLSHSYTVKENKFTYKAALKNVTQTSPLSPYISDISPEAPRVRRDTRRPCSARPAGERWAARLLKQP